MTQDQANKLVQYLEDATSSKTRALTSQILGCMKSIPDEQLYPVAMVILAYAFKRNHTLMANLLLLGHKLIEESYKGEHEIVVDQFNQSFLKLFKEDMVQ